LKGGLPVSGGKGERKGEHFDLGKKNMANPIRKKGRGAFWPVGARSLELRGEEKGACDGAKVRE